jgi:rfaE bifunctional protein nucleotidyltransferase chain/domain
MHQQVGFVNGCFDVLHIGHIEMLGYAKSLCDHLVVAIDTDDRVRQAKGPTRPFNNQSDRQHMLMALKAVDEVTIFSTDEELVSLIKHYEPDIMVVGSDWENKEVLGSEHAKKLEFYRRVDGYSTTKILERSFGR